MFAKNSHIILAFIYFALLVLSSPIKNDSNKTLKSSQEEEEEVTLSAIEISDNEEIIEDSGVEILSYVEEESQAAISNDDLIKSEVIKEIEVTDKIQEIDNGFRFGKVEGNYGLDEFIKRNGTTSVMELIAFFKENNFFYENTNITLEDHGFACSSFLVHKKDEDGFYFGRNFDYSNSKATVLLTYPENGYSSISTVNLSFIKDNNNSLTEDEIKYFSVYAPVDGMNEKGLTVSANMVGFIYVDNDTPKPDITPSIAIRLLLDKAATVEEAINILKEYDMHQSLGLYNHFAITDAEGNAVVVEYINNEMTYVHSPINENFFLTPGDYYGNYVYIYSEDNIEIFPVTQDRYNIIKERLEKYPTMTRE
ncbi:N-terminal nucleophile aminohydrolase [Neocallimastix lanati (nom. inval.)]|uniref:N-terminal nucleophile aminohydrolase n=1 Tax=Neocallimastix californiae TaxID=1754190 RepID=A0A1Y1YQT6_9FUNG|nr:N-terminal nucleophile aminohydrolase [Neocallimastix sp. JGI-2020a]ORY00398.1 N-terminal nucleophile aminohydrolase [Neocallimastix californiae]|eukprot:ORY00398.1 N-terminal nucleophile aminohydrolase [Neocallimastix californiae]